MVKVQSGQCPSSAPVPPRGEPALWAARYSKGEAGPLISQTLPREIELVASKAAHFPAFDHIGGGLKRAWTSAEDWTLLQLVQENGVQVLSPS